MAHYRGIDRCLVERIIICAFKNIVYMEIVEPGKAVGGDQVEGDEQKNRRRGQGHSEVASSHVNALDSFWTPCVTLRLSRGPAKSIVGQMLMG